MKKLPPYAKALASRQRFRNLPELVIVCIGQDAWIRANKWQQHPNGFVAIVCTPDTPPDAYSWPVAGCFCLVDWDIGPSESQILKLVECLLKSGAESVTVNPIFANLRKPSHWYDVEKPPGKRWTQQREKIQTYRQKAVQNAA